MRQSVSSHWIHQYCRGAMIALLCGSLFGAAEILAQNRELLGIRSNTPLAHAFTNARIVISPDKTIERGTLLIDNGKVISVGQNLAVPEGVMTTDLEGYTIYPGLIDAYTQYGVEKAGERQRQHGSAPQYYNDRVGGNAWNGAVHAEENWGTTFRPDDSESKELIKLGFTTVQSVRMDGVFRGRSCVALLGEGLPNDLLIRPCGYHVASFDKGSSEQDYPESLMGAIALIRQTLYDVDWYQQARAAYNLNGMQEMPEFNAAIEALADMKNEKLILDGGTSSLSIYRMQRLGQEFGMPIVGVVSGYEYTRLDDHKKIGYPLILPLDFPEAPPIESMADELDISFRQLRHWEMAPSNPARVAEAGIPFALTTHRLKKASDFSANLRKAIKRGLSEHDALTALTVTAAEICGISDLTGTLESGKLANFVVTDGDLFDAKTKLYSVWIAGQENFVSPRPTTAFGGNYDLQIKDQQWKLTLEDDRGVVTGKLTISEEAKDLVKVKIDRNQIQFSATLDTAKTTGLTRFNGRLIGQVIKGQCELTSGELASWSANRTGEATESDSTAGDKTEPEAEEILSHLTYPNMAFGFEQLPVKQDVLIKNATVWTADEPGILENTDVLVRNGKFAEVGQNLSAAEDVLVIDAQGKHVTPGVIDPHAHLAGEGDINEGTHANSAEVRCADIINPNQIDIYRQLAGGTTASLLLHGSANPIGGQAQLLKLRWGANPEGLKFAGAPDLIKFALGENVKQSGWGERYNLRYPQSRMGVEAIIRDALVAALDYEKQWQEYKALSKKEKQRRIPPRKDLQLDAIVELLHDRMLVQCHGYKQSEMLMLMRLAEEFGFTIDLFGHTLEGYKIADEMAKHGAGAIIFSDWWAYKFEVYDAIPYHAGLLVERGVLTAMHSDNNDLARRLNQEAGKAVMYSDMDQAEAIKLVTINPAKMVGVGDRTGSITVGKDADFVIWTDNPLSLYARAEQTWIDGAKYYDIETNSRMVDELEAEKSALIQKVLKASSSGKKGK